MVQVVLVVEEGNARREEVEGGRKGRREFFLSKVKATSIFEVDEL